MHILSSERWQFLLLCSYLNPPPVQRLLELVQHARPAGVNATNSTHVEDDVLHAGLALGAGPFVILVDPPGEPLAKVAGVGEVDGGVHAQHEHAGHRPRRRVLVHPAVDVGVRHVAQHRRPRPRHEEQHPQHRDGHGHHQPHLDAAEDDAEVGPRADAEVHLVHVPEVHGGREVDEPQHRRHDDRRQHHQRRVVEERRQEEERHHHRQRHDHVGHGRLAPGVVVDGGPGEGPRGEVAGGEGAQDVHRPDGDHLLVAVDVVVLEHGEAPADGDPFGEGDDAGDEAGLQGEHHVRRRELEVCNGDWVQAFLQITDYLNAMVFGMGEVDQEAPEDDRRQWRGGGYPEEPRLPLAEEAGDEEEEEEAAAEHHALPSPLVCLGEDGAHDGDEVGGGGEVLQPQHALELLQAHHRRRAAHEPHDRRVRQEVHDEAQPEDAERGLDDAGEEGRREGQVEVERRVLRRRHLGAQHGGDEQRRHRHRPHRQVLGAPHHRVHQR
uniref:Uncharacterized protein n=1 Tax=Aegilops tauschii subsp. strangulata TaxID=200361 RepID=A0A453ITG4_AEGTS